MKTGLYILNGVCGRDGQYLLGVFRWSMGVRIERVRVQAVAGVGMGWSFPTVLGLEVDGILSEVTIGLVGSQAGGEIDRSMKLRLDGVDGFAVRAGAELRWVRLSGPAAPEDGVSEIALEMEVGDEGEGAAVFNGLTVKWTQGLGYDAVPIYQFDPATEEFNEVFAGAAAGKASVTGGDDFVAEIEDELAMQSFDGALNVGTLLETGALGGRGADDFPMLEFWIGQKRVATLTQSGVFRAVTVRESASVSDVVSGNDRFRFYAGGVAVGVLSAKGMFVTTDLVEGFLGGLVTSDGAEFVDAGGALVDVLGA